MNSNRIAARVKSVLESRILFFLLGLAVWSAGVMSGSVVLMVITSVAIYAMPFVYVAALNHVENAQHKTRQVTSKTAKRVSLTQAHFSRTLLANVK